MPSADAFVAAAHAAGCPRDQVEALGRCGIILQPKQLAASAIARQCDLEGGPTQLGFGGARGGGKSHWGLGQLTDDCLRQDGLTCLLLRKVGSSNRENFEELRTKVLKTVPTEYRRGEGILSYANGSKIILGHFQNESDIDKYLGLEYDVILVEEATTLTASKYKAIRTCCRTSKAGWRPRMYSTTNPGGVGHAWYKATFINPWQRRTEGGTRFVHATLDDNEMINPEYRDTLDGLSGWMYRAWRLGDWDIAAGQFFTNWRTRDLRGHPYHVIPPFKVPAHWRTWGSFDYGWTHYTVFHLHAQDGDGNVYTIGEHAQRKTLPARHADAIHALCLRHGRLITPQPGVPALPQLWRVVAGHDVFDKKSDEGRTVADDYKELGIPFTRATIDRINGAAVCLSYLGDPDALPDPIAPRAFVFAPCQRLIESIPSLEHDPHRPEDVLKVDTDDDGLGGDDAYDSWRYGLMEVAHASGKGQGARAGGTKTAYAATRSLGAYAGGRPDVIV